MTYPMIIVNTSLPLVLKLNPSPNSIDVKRAKIFSQMQTASGWVFEHWGEKPYSLSVTGKIAPKFDFTTGIWNDIQLEAALISLQNAF